MKNTAVQVDVPYKHANGFIYIMYSRYFSDTIVSSEAELKQIISYYYSYQSAAECVVVLVGDGGVGEVDRRVRDARSLTH